MLDGSSDTAHKINSLLSVPAFTDEYRVQTPHITSIRALVYGIRMGGGSIPSEILIAEKDLRRT
jgi:hypothetical protein